MPRFRRPRSPVHALRRAAAALLAAMALALALRPEAAPAARRSEQRLPVVVAGHDLAAGTVLTATELRTTRLPPAYVPAEVVPDAASLVGRVVAGAVRAGEPLTDVRLVGQGLTRLLQDHEVGGPARLGGPGAAGRSRGRRPGPPRSPGRRPGHPRRSRPGRRHRDGCPRPGRTGTASGGTGPGRSVGGAGGARGVSRDAQNACAG